MFSNKRAAGLKLFACRGPAPDEKIIKLKHAVELYKGDFMEGNYETWCEELRSKYRTYFISMSEDLSEMLFDNDDFDGSLHYSENLLRFDKLNLGGYENIINCMVKLEKPQIAKVRYSQLAKYYKKEYDESLPEKLSAKLEKIIAES